MKKALLFIVSALIGTAVSQPVGPIVGEGALEQLGIAAMATALLWWVLRDLTAKLELMRVTIEKQAAAFDELSDRLEAVTRKETK